MGYAEAKAAAEAPEDTHFDSTGAFDTFIYSLTQSTPFWSVDGRRSMVVMFVKCGGNTDSLLKHLGKYHKSRVAFMKNKRTDETYTWFEGLA